MNSKQKDIEKLTATVNVERVKIAQLESKKYDLKRSILRSKEANDQEFVQIKVYTDKLNSHNNKLVLGMSEMQMKHKKQVGDLE